MCRVKIVIAYYVIEQVSDYNYLGNFTSTEGTNNNTKLQKYKKNLTSLNIILENRDGRRTWKSGYN